MSSKERFRKVEKPSLEYHMKESLPLNCTAQQSKTELPLDNEYPRFGATKGNIFLLSCPLKKCIHHICQDG
jgi:hypothetical protein